MRTFNITVNGKTYVVDVDEQGVPASRGPAAAPAPAPTPAPAPAPAPAAAPAAQGGTPVKAGVRSSRSLLCPDRKLLPAIPS